MIFISLILYTHRNHENRGMHFVFYESSVFLNERVCILTLNDANADAAKSVRVWEIIIRMGSLARSNNMLLEREIAFIHSNLFAHALFAFERTIIFV